VGKSSGAKVNDPNKMKPFNIRSRGIKIKSKTIYYLLCQMLERMQVLPRSRAIRNLDPFQVFQLESPRDDLNEQEQFTKYPVVYGFEFAFSSLAREETFLEELRKQTLRNTDGINEDSTIDKEINDFAGLVGEISNDERYAFALTAPGEYSETCALHSSIIIYLKQKKLIAGDAEHSSIFNRFEEEF
jgi:hypothetical protein